MNLKRMFNKLVELVKNIFAPLTMAPNPLDTVDEELKNTITSLYTIQSSTHGYLGNETQTALVNEANNLLTSLDKLQTLARPSYVNTRDPAYDPNAPQHCGLPAQLPPEVISYVDEGRNPDIYTREFVELTQRGNAYLKGKSNALGMFAEILSEEIKKEWPEMTDLMDKIMRGEGTGGKEALVKSVGEAREQKNKANGETKKEQ